MLGAGAKIAIVVGRARKYFDVYRLLLKIHDLTAKKYMPNHEESILFNFAKFCHPNAELLLPIFKELCVFES